MILAGALEAKGMSRSVLLVRLLFTWCGTVPALAWISHTHSGDAGYVATCWIIGSIAEIAIAITYGWLFYRRSDASSDVFAGAAEDAE